MADRLILHVGPHKTATTALQHLFFDHRGLLADHGIAYPAVTASAKSHEALFQEVRSGQSRAVADTARADTKGASTVLLSSENMSFLDRDKLRQIAGLWPGAEVTIVYFLRRLSESWPSHWAETIKHGAPRTFAHYMAQVAADHPQTMRSALAPMQHLATLQDTFGKGALQLHGYDAVTAAGGDIGRYVFGTVLNMPKVPGSVRCARVNLSAPPWMTELCRMINAFAAWHLSHPDILETRHRLLALLRTAPPPWIEMFKTAIHRSETLLIGTDTPLIQTYQLRLLDKFGEAIAGDWAAVTRAYLGQSTRQIPHPDWSAPALQPLLREIRACYEGLTHQFGARR